MGELTHKLILLITLKLRSESYDKVIAGAKAFTTKTRKIVHANNIIDLTTDGPEEFAAIVDISSDDEGEFEEQEDVEIEDGDGDGDDDDEKGDD